MTSSRRTLRALYLLMRRWHSVEELYRKVGLSHRALQRLIRDLADIGFVVAERKEDHTPEYRVSP